MASWAQPLTESASTPAVQYGRTKSPSVDSTAKDLEKLHEKQTSEPGPVTVDAQEPKPPSLYQRFRPLILGALAALILGWWISATVLKATRHRWYAWSILQKTR